MHECKRKPVRNICNANEFQTVHNFDKFMKPLVHVSLNQPPLTRQYSANSFFVFSQFNSTSTKNLLLLEILVCVLEIIFLLCSPNCDLATQSWSQWTQSNIDSLVFVRQDHQSLSWQQLRLGPRPSRIDHLAGQSSWWNQCIGLR